MSAVFICTLGLLAAYCSGYSIPQFPKRPGLSFSSDLSISLSDGPNGPANPCQGNAPDNRQQWCDYDINTDYTTTFPNTGVTREFWLVLDQTIIAPDGRPRWAITVNGSMPGPTLEVNWGDTVVVHLQNNLPASLQNGTSLHFHGIRQLWTNPMDGVVSLTQCPLPPGQTLTYRWRATQYGTTWYHSHTGLQTWEGVFGGIVINGPASANYDEDTGLILLNDWDIQTVNELWYTAECVGSPMLDNALINGMNVFGENGDPNQTGQRFEMRFEPGKSYRLRLGNAAVDTFFKFSIDHHVLRVIAADLVPIQPYYTTVLNIAIGQRYDVIVHADQHTTASSFWLRAVPQLSCSRNSNANNIRGIIYYDDNTDLPIITPYTSIDACEDENPSNLSPNVSQPFILDTSAADFYDESLPVSVTMTPTQHFRWELNNMSMQPNWTHPTLEQLKTFTNPECFPQTEAIIPLPQADTWVLAIIETALDISHPIHLHGLDFLVVSQGSGPFLPPTSESQPYNSPAGSLPKRDTALLPGGGHLALAFKTDNPGAWMLHCHIGWHLMQGFAVQFLERGGDVRRLLLPGGYWEEQGKGIVENCQRWEAFCAEDGL